MLAIISRAGGPSLITNEAIPLDLERHGKIIDQTGPSERVNQFT